MDVEVIAVLKEMKAKASTTGPVMELKFDAINCAAIELDVLKQALGKALKIKLEGLQRAMDLS